MKTLFFAVAAIAFAAALGFTYQRSGDEMPDQLYVNGTVLTMDMNNSIAQAVAVKDGKILAVGTAEVVKKLAGTTTRMIDLGGKTMIPGLIDGHSHMMGLGTRYADLSPLPFGTVKSIPDIILTLKKYQSEQHLSDSTWLSGFGYDQDQMLEKRHPTKEDLDRSFPNTPVTISHISGHMIVANSYALRISGITENTKDPPGGTIIRKPGSTEPTGLLQESASRLLKIVRPLQSGEQRLTGLRDVQMMYASFGITTAQDGFSGKETLALLTEAASKNLLLMDIESLAGYPLVDSLIAAKFPFGVMNNHFKVAGFKMIADGSPQGKTAFFSKPYLTAVPGCSHDSCTGIPTVTQAEFDEAISKSYKNNIRSFVHCNGDGAVDMYIRAIEKANHDTRTTALNRRPVVIHSQFVRNDQLEKYKSLGMMPAFFTNHAFFWGDVHVQNLGKDRADFLSPLKTVKSKGILFTNHTDYPVTPINQMFLLWTSVARQSRTNQVIGSKERLTAMEGLRAITINGAYQYKEEASKGSIEKGKLADFAILSANPVQVETAAIKDIIVLETIKEGTTIFKRMME